MGSNTVGQMEPFDHERGDDWPTYVKRLEQYFAANGMTEEKKMVAVLVTVMGAKAYGLMRNLLAPVKPADKKYTELIQVMKDHLSPVSYTHLTLPTIYSV